MIGNPLKINTLIPTQYDVRCLDSIINMTSFVTNGEIFDQNTIIKYGESKNRLDNPLISICQLLMNKFIRLHCL